MKNDNQYDDFINLCRNVDFSASSKNKDRNLQSLRRNRIQIQNEGELTMRKKTGRPVIVAAVAAMLILGTSAVYGSEIINIVKQVFLGGSQYVVTDSDSIPVPEALQGKLFDADGNELTMIAQNEKLYNANGEEVYFDHDGEGNVSVLTVDEYTSKYGDSKSAVFTNYEEGTSYFITDVKQPSYLPEGYVFQRISFYAGISELQENEKSRKYMAAYYMNGDKEFYINHRFMDDDTAYAVTTGNDVKELTINGNKAVQIGNKALTVLIGDVEYSLYGLDNVSMDELIKVAESIK